MMDKINLIPLNLSQVPACKRKLVRFQDWDEENRLRMVVGANKAGYYGYDANGDRVYKLAGGSNLDDFGWNYVDASVRFEDATLYPNPYMVITPQLYTKHYYANGERLATIVGRGGFYNMSPDAITTNITEHENFLYRDWSQRYQTDYPFNYCRDEYNVTENIDIDSSSYYEIQYHCGPHPVRRLYINLSSDILLNTIYSNLYVNNIEDEVYYTHNNHLGSAAWIMERHGGPVQYLHYLS